MCGGRRRSRWGEEGSWNCKAKVSAGGAGRCPPAAGSWHRTICNDGGSKFSSSSCFSSAPGGGSAAGGGPAGGGRESEELCSRAFEALAAASSPPAAGTDVAGPSFLAPSNAEPTPMRRPPPIPAAGGRAPPAPASNAEPTPARRPPPPPPAADPVPPAPASKAEPMPARRPVPAVSFVEDTAGGDGVSSSGFASLLLLVKRSLMPCNHSEDANFAGVPGGLTGATCGTGTAGTSATGVAGAGAVTSGAGAEGPSNTRTSAAPCGVGGASSCQSSACRGGRGDNWSGKAGGGGGGRRGEASSRFASRRCSSIGDGGCGGGKNGVGGGLSATPVSRGTSAKGRGGGSGAVVGSCAELAREPAFGGSWRGGGAGRPAGPRPNSTCTATALGPAMPGSAVPGSFEGKVGIVGFAMTNLAGGFRDTPLCGLEMRGGGSGNAAATNSAIDIEGFGSSSDGASPPGGLAVESAFGFLSGGGAGHDAAAISGAAPVGTGGLAFSDGAGGCSSGSVRGRRPGVGSRHGVSEGSAGISTSSGGGATAFSDTGAGAGWRFFEALRALFGRFFELLLVLCGRSGTASSGPSQALRLVLITISSLGLAAGILVIGMGFTMASRPVGGLIEDGGGTDLPMRGRSRKEPPCTGAGACEAICGSSILSNDGWPLLVEAPLLLEPALRMDAPLLGGVCRRADPERRVEAEAPVGGAERFGVPDRQLCPLRNGVLPRPVPPVAGGVSDREVWQEVPVFGRLVPGRLRLIELAP
mmetsp:Transcript_146055/g.468417  ORF Transcript_146055/g.468417 Transcript_146055/m.468417 type:complete len:756 (-) Transcript_146055:5116-7383(-)